MALIKINGRTKFFNVDSMAVTKVSAGRFKVVYDQVVAEDGEVVSEGSEFLVVGGRESGGASHEWFCYHPRFYGESWLPTKSMVEAVRLGAVY